MCRGAKGTRSRPAVPRDLLGHSVDLPRGPWVIGIPRRATPRWDTVSASRLSWCGSRQIRELETEMAIIRHGAKFLREDTRA